MFQGEHFTSFYLLPKSPLPSLLHSRDSWYVPQGLMQTNKSYAMNPAFAYALYRPQPFINETKQIEFLFELYDKYTSGMFGEEGKKTKSKK